GARGSVAVHRDLAPREIADGGLRGAAARALRPRRLRRRGEQRTEQSERGGPREERAHRGGSWALGAGASSCAGGGSGAGGASGSGIASGAGGVSPAGDTGAGARAPCAFAARSYMVASAKRACTW